MDKENAQQRIQLSKYLFKFSPQKARADLVVRVQEVPFIVSLIMPCGKENPGGCRLSIT
jgi:hypothetical protein